MVTQDDKEVDFGVHIGSLAYMWRRVAKISKAMGIYTVQSVARDRLQMFDYLVGKLLP